MLPAAGFVLAACSGEPELFGSEEVAGAAAPAADDGSEPEAADAAAEAVTPPVAAARAELLPEEALRAEGPGFDFDDVRAKASLLATQPYQTPPGLPKEAASLDYDAYRRIELLPEGTIWGSDAEQRFRVLPDPRGYLFNTAVRLNLIENGQEVARPYKPEDFNFHDLPLPDEARSLLGYSGFRIVTPLNVAGKFDELVSFRGASFFRALGAGNLYGASARGISIGTASAEGEEFPYFREFWLEKPAPGADQVRLFALLDGRSLTGAYEFTFRPGPETVVVVNAVLYPRRTLTHAGIAPLTSMYFFSPHDVRKYPSDFRPAVYDSEGLAIRMKNGEAVWRPLSNPKSLQVSVLASRAPQGFGLQMRHRRFDDFADIEAGYHYRPSVWIEPGEDWGEGELTLVEIPTANEYNDNIVAYWRPAEPLNTGTAYPVSYTMRWSLMNPAASGVSAVSNTLAGIKPGAAQQLFIIDFDPIAETLLDGAEAEISTTAGKVLNPIIKTNPENGKTRLSFELDAQNADVAELRALISKGGKPITETWLYRWRKE